MSFLTSERDQDANSHPGWPSWSTAARDNVTQRRSQHGHPIQYAFFIYVFKCLPKYIFPKMYPMDIKVQDKISIMAYWEITSWGKKQHKMNINRSIQIKINRNQCGKSFSELYSLPSIVVSYLHVVYCVFEDKRDHSLIKDKVCLHFIFWDCPFTIYIPF